MKGYKIILFLLIFSAVSSAWMNSGNKYIPVFLPNGEKITAELAVTDEERQRGLMFRDELGENQGMLFIFKSEGFYSFWMKNVNFSIDILWLNADKRIVHIEENVPPCKNEPCPSYTPDLPALYVLELKAGSVKENCLNLYQRLEFIIPF